MRKCYAKISTNKNRYSSWWTFTGVALGPSSTIISSTDLPKAYIVGMLKTYQSMSPYIEVTEREYLGCGCFNSIVDSLSFLLISLITSYNVSFWWAVSFSVSDVISWPVPNTHTQHTFMMTAFRSIFIAMNLSPVFWNFSWLVPNTHWWHASWGVFRRAWLEANTWWWSLALRSWWYVASCLHSSCWYACICIVALRSQQL